MKSWLFHSLRSRCGRRVPTGCRPVALGFPFSRCSNSVRCSPGIPTPPPTSTTTARPAPSRCDRLGQCRSGSANRHHPAFVGHLHADPGRTRDHGYGPFAGNQWSGSSGPNATIIDQLSLDRVFQIAAASVTFENVEITGGIATDNDAGSNATEADGGGILSDGSLTLDNVSVTGNKALANLAGEMPKGAASTPPAA